MSPYEQTSAPAGIAMGYPSSIGQLVSQDTLVNFGLYTGLALPAIGLNTTTWDYMYGLSNYVVTTASQFSGIQAVLGSSVTSYLTALNAVIAPQESVSSVFPVSRPSDRILEAETEFVVAAAHLPSGIRDTLTQNFSQLTLVLREEDAPIQLQLDSLRIALRFLSSARQRLAPYFSLNELGNFYLQWFNDCDSVVGVTFRADGMAIWSSSQPDPTRPATRSVEAGERSAESLGQILNGIAPWAFNDGTA